MSKRDEFQALKDMVLGRDPIHAEAVVHQAKRTANYIMACTFALFLVSTVIGFIWAMYKILPWRCSP